MFNILVKYIFGPGEHPDNHSELIKNVKRIESTHEGENQFIYIEYTEFVFDKEKMWFSEESREKVIALPVARYLDVKHMTRELVKKADLLCDLQPGINRVKDKFLKVVIKHFAEPVDGIDDKKLIPSENIMSQVELGLTVDGEHYDKDEFLVYWSEVQA